MYGAEQNCEKEAQTKISKERNRSFLKLCFKVVEDQNDIQRRTKERDIRNGK